LCCDQWAEGYRELALIGVLPTFAGREGLERSAFYYGKSGKGDPFLLLQQQLVGFWPRVRAPVFLGAFTPLTGRCAPPPTHRSFAASYSSSQNKNKTISRKKCFPSGPKSGREGLLCTVVS
jgi:hypothetical protein